MMRVTVQDIADALGLSKYAVSRALSGKSGVSERTRQAVIKKAEDLGYTARRRASRRSGAIEIIYHDQGVAHRELWIEVQAGAQTEANRLGIGTAVRWTDDPKIAHLVTSPNTGFLLIGPHENAMLDATTATGQPCVCVGNHPWRDMSGMDFIYSTDKEATRKVGEHLLNLGHRRIAYAHGKPGYPGRIKRFQTFAKALEGRAELDDMTFSDDNAPGDFQHDLLSMAKRGFEPTAFFCGNDGVAVTVISQLMRMGLQIPRDMSVVGFADYAIATQIAPALTTVRVPYRAMGALSVRILMSRLGKNDLLTDLTPLRIGLVPELIERESTGPVSDLPLLSKLQG